MSLLIALDSRFPNELSNLTVEFLPLEFLIDRIPVDILRRCYRRYDKEVNWKDISQNQTLSEEFIKEFQDKVDWLDISRHQTLSEEFIKEFQDKVDWFYISGRQILSEDFIRDFQDKVNWNIISNYQIISEDFVREFQDKVVWTFLLRNENIYDVVKERMALLFGKVWDGWPDWWILNKISKK